MADSVLVSEASCLVCRSTGNLKRCTRCRTARYCSKEHQVQHWKIHKLQCVQKKPSDGASSATPMVATDGTGAESVTSPDFAAAQAGDADAGEPFDERPLRLVDFEKPASSNDEATLEFTVQCLKRDGFCVLDNVMTDKECKKLLDEIRELESSGILEHGKLAGGTASSSQIDMVVNHSIRGDKIVWLEGNESEYPSISQLVATKMDNFILPLTAHFSGDIVINGRTKAMVACYPGEGTAYRRHVDNPTKDGRVITCIFYANKDWDAQMMGGVLRIFPASRPGDYVDVAPLLNRMLLFWSDGRNPHEVRPAYATRYAITMWYFNAEERVKAKEAQVAAAISETERSIEMVHLKTKEVEKEILEKKVKATTSTAIGNLNEDELAGATQRTRPVEVFFDLETTGLEGSCHITQLAAVQPNREKVFCIYVRPGKPISSQASEITGLWYNVHEGKMLLHGQPVDSVSITEALQQFLSWIGTRRVILVAHNAHRFDMKHIMRATEETGLLEEFTAKVVGFLDTLKLFRAVIPYKVPGGYALKNIIQHLLKEGYNAHDALEDSAALLKAFKEIAIDVSDAVKDEHTMWI